MIAGAEKKESRDGEIDKTEDNQKFLEIKTSNTKTVIEDAKELISSCRCFRRRAPSKSETLFQEAYNALEEKLRAAQGSRDDLEEMLRAAWIREQKLEHLVELCVLRFLSKQKNKICLLKFAKRNHWKSSKTSIA